jgi:hypothetical protein
MKTRIDERLRQEAKLYRFQFSCESCAHFDDVGQRCAEGYPNDEHIDGALGGEEVLFCKLWEGA